MPFAPIFWLLTACPEPTTDHVANCCDSAGDSADSADSGGETGDTEVAEHIDATATLSTVIPTVMTVRWITQWPGTSRVEWGQDASYGFAVEGLTATATHSVAVAGLPAETEVHWRAITQVDGVIYTGPDQTITSGSNADAPPALDVVPEFVGNFGENPFLTSTVGGSNSVQIYDATGSAIWWEYAEAGTSVADSRVSRDGTAVLMEVQPSDKESDATFMRRMSWDGTDVLDTPLPFGHHDFIELPDGNYGFCMIDVREYEGMPVVGDAIAEMPPGGDPTTDLKIVWSTWDDIPMTATVENDTRFYSFGLDWIHCNGLLYDERDGSYLMSAHSLGAMFKVDRDAGELIWTFGGENSDFQLTSGAFFVEAHSPEFTETGLRLFDNGDTDSPEGFSRIVEYSLDEATFTAAEGWSYNADEAYSTDVLGDVDPMPNGNFQLSWGKEMVYEQITPEGENVWTASLLSRSLAGFVHPVAQVGGPGLP